MRIFTSLGPQWLAVVEVSLLALIIIMSSKWNTTFVETLSTQYDIQTWIELLRSLSKLFGIILGTISTSLMGASITIYTCGLFCLVNSICLMFSNISDLVKVYLICSEIVLGMFICASPIYIGEMSNPKIRGKLVSFVVQSAITGNLIGDLAGIYLGPRSSGAIICIISISVLATFFHFPPTSYYLMSRGKAQKALESIKWYDRETNGRNEVESLTTFFKANPIMPFFKTIPTIFSSKNRKIFLLFIDIYILQNLGGLFAISFRMEVLFNNAYVKISNPHELVITVGVIATIVSWLIFFISDVFERNHIIFIGCTTLSIALLTWGLGYHLIELGFSEQISWWVILISAIIYQTIINTIYLPVIFTMMSELFSPNIKNIAICLCNIVFYNSLFVTIKYFDSLSYFFRHEIIFCLFSLVTEILGIFYASYIPKTKGKSLEEIQVMLNNKIPSLESIKL